MVFPSLVVPIIPKVCPILPSNALMWSPPPRSLLPKSAKLKKPWARPTHWANSALLLEAVKPGTDWNRGGFDPLQSGSFVWWSHAQSFTKNTCSLIYSIFHPMNHWHGSCLSWSSALIPFADLAAACRSSLRIFEEAAKLLIFIDHILIIW